MINHPGNHITAVKPITLVFVKKHAMDHGGARMKRVLLVIDMQNDFCHPEGALYIAEVERIIPRVDEAVCCAHAAGAMVLFTRDLHQADDPEFDRFPPHCVEGTWGADLISEMPVEEGDIHLSKPTFNAFHGTNLSRILEGASQVYVAGVAADLSVLYTTADAVMNGIEVAILRDCTIGITPAGERAAMYHLEEMLQVPLLSLSRFTALLGCA
jgi:nicotinamidase-related amidase